MFCHILRDADKIDILKVNVEFPLEEIYNVDTEVLYQEEVTPEVLQSFDEEHAVLRSLKKRRWIMWWDIFRWCTSWSIPRAAVL